MGKSLEYTMECGCEIWDGNDYMDRGFLFIKRCDYHKYIDEEGPEDRQQKDSPDKKEPGKCYPDYFNGQIPWDADSGK